MTSKVQRSTDVNGIHTAVVGSGAVATTKEKGVKRCTNAYVEYAVRRFMQRTKDKSSALMSAWLSQSVSGRSGISGDTAER